jgi:hypothetical protein
MEILSVEYAKNCTKNPFSRIGGAIIIAWYQEAMAGAYNCGPADSNRFAPISELLVARGFNITPLAPADPAVGNANFVAIPA